MDVIGIIVEYNPFHNGHLYHIEQVKKLYPNSILVAVMSGNFTQRGDVSIIDKWSKTKIALENQVDIVIELPYFFAGQAADIFAKGAIQILKEMKVDAIVFGSESNNIDILNQLADIQLYNEEYQELVKSYLDLGFNYPTSMSKGLKEISAITLIEPNDILGLCYVKEIMSQKAKITPVTIKRTIDYNSEILENSISSASSIRKALKEKKEVKNQVPKETYKALKKQLFFNANYFKFLKYKILSEDNLKKYHTVDEGIESRLKEMIKDSKTFEEYVKKIKTKRYTYNKITRTLMHILNNVTKEEIKKYKDIEYIRVLGFSKVGQKYLASLREKTSIPIITNFSASKSEMLKLEQRTTNVYASILEEVEKNKLIESEYKNGPIKSN